MAQDEGRRRPRQGGHSRSHPQPGSDAALCSGQRSGCQERRIPSGGKGQGKPGRAPHTGCWPGGHMMSWGMGSVE